MPLNRIKKEFPILSDIYARNFFIAAFVLIVGIGAFALRALRNVHHLLVLSLSHISPTFFGTRTSLLGIVGIAFIAVTINFFLAHMLYSRMRFLSYVLAAGSTFLGILIFIAVAVIIAAN